MPTDDSRGSDAPDRPDESTDTDTQTASLAGYGERLGAIEAISRDLLAAVEATADADDCDLEWRRDAVRHLREIRAEAAFARRALSRRPVHEGVTTDRDDGTVPMIRTSGGGGTVVHGPDPIAFQRTRGDADEQ
ncbi:hypothetical protein [Natrinema altunense]|uniref:Uncharacterized protein n=1 Tax=Natrinema altunense TaxID=222984 RepID=A0A482XUR1_9EURY|nr:hypothetical protein [Natrinema altunense]RZH66999.1 hypothetical protein ELS17_14595 [Natrinema altunense]